MTQAEISLGSHLQYVIKRLKIIIILKDMLNVKSIDKNNTLNTYNLSSYHLDFWNLIIPNWNTPYKKGKKTEYALVR
jgi:hypothetical protein